MSSGFAELAARSHYSFLEGSSSPEEMVAAAVAAGLSALALCDRNGLYGAVALADAAGRAGLHAVIGAEVDLTDGSRLRLLARDRHGYRQLSRALSAAQLAGEKGQPRLDLFGDHPAGSTAARGRRRPTPPPPERPAALRPTAGPFPSGWPGLPSQRPLPTGPPARIDPADLDGCIVLAGGPDSVITAGLIAGDHRGAARHADRMREAFGRDHLALLLTHHLHPADGWLAAETARLAHRCGLPVVASNTPVHATSDDKPLLDVLTAIRHRTTLDAAAAHGLLLPNREHRVKSGAELRRLLGAHPEAFDHAAHLADQCRVSLDFRDVRFPGFAVAAGDTPLSMLRRLCEQALPQRYDEVTVAVRSRLERELGVIERTGLAEFFLITWDIMRFARENAIPGQGRGSAADSLVAYLLGITRVDPIAHNLLFERFLHEEYRGTPDIDIDFSTEHREQVLQYVYERYGAERTGMVANVVTFRPRMAIRQVGAAMGFPETVVDRLARSVESWYHGGVDEALRAAGYEDRLTPARPGAGGASTDGDGIATLPWPLLMDMLHRIAGTPRHLGIHVGGMLVTGQPLVDLVPVERATMPGRVVVQFDKDDVEDLGLIKMDLLGLRTLSLVAECLDLVEATTGSRPDLDRLPLDDPRVYDSICAPDTIGVFQIESRAQQQALYRSQPREFNDLIIQVAIIRPGPIQGDAVHPFLRRREGVEEVTYLHPSLEPILAETRGVILYQEQILRIVMEVAGYSPGEADAFRRAMNRHRSRVEMQGLHDEFVARCAARDIGETAAEAIFKAAAGFAQFGFCKSHAAAFARTAYETAWLRLEHPAAYLCALLNAQPMGFYHPSVLVEDGKRHGVLTLPVDVARSRARCRLEWAADARPPAHAVAAGLTPGWRLDGGAVVRDGARSRPPTPGEAAAERAVATALQGVATGPLQDAVVRGARPRSPGLHGDRVSPWAVRLGYSYVRGLGPTGRAACEAASLAGAVSVVDFWRHTRLSRPAMENLVLLGAFDSVEPGRSRRALLWELRAVEDGLPPRRRVRAAAGPVLAGTRAALPGGREAPRTETVLPPGTAAPPAVTGPPRGRGAVQGLRPGDAPPPARDLAADPLPPLLSVPAASPPLPEMSVREQTATEYRLSELSTGPHLVSFLRPRLDALGCTPIARVAARGDGARLRVAGLVVVRQAPVSANGFRFFTLADEGGHLDLVFRPRVTERTRSVANFHPLLVVDGVLQAEAGRLNLVVTEVRAIDSEGNLVAPRRARYGGGAARTAPPTQHGRTPAPRDADPTLLLGAGHLPPSHDFR